MPADTEPRHPIGVVSSRTGIPQDVLRAWERRYGAVTPTRTDTGRRLYSDHDLQRFRLLKLVVESGRRISDVAGLSMQELQSLAEEDRNETPAAAPAPRAGKKGALPIMDGATLLAESLRAVEGLDGNRLRQILNEAAVVMTPAALRREILVPLMRETGDRWRDGSFRISHEHLASAIVRSFLGAVSTPAKGAGGPRVVMATPVGCDHEFGALLASQCASEVGWDPIYLGTGLPAAEIAGAARGRDATAVALSVTYPESSADLHDELRLIREMLDDSVELIVGGRASESYRETLDEIGARWVPEFADLQDALETIAGKPRT